MIMKKMLQLCNRAKEIAILYCGCQKLLSNGYVAADITKIAPDWDIDDIIIALDIPEEKAESYKQIEKRIGETPHDRLIEVSDFEQLERLSYSININGVSYQPFRLSDHRLIVADLELLSIFKDEGIKTYRFGYIDKEQPIIFVCCDSVCIGLVAPSRIDLSHLKSFADTISDAADNSINVGFMDAGGQMELQD